MMDETAQYIKVASLIIQLTDELERLSFHNCNSSHSENINFYDFLYYQETLESITGRDIAEEDAGKVMYYMKQIINIKPEAE